MIILTPLQKKFLELFFSTYFGEKFFLTGGSALAAFYLKHRLSQDLGLFTLDQDLTFDEVNAEVRKIAKKLKLKVSHQVSSPTFLQFIFKTPQKEQLKIDIVRDVPVHFGKIKRIDDLRVDSLENIAIGKILAIFGRIDAKDFIDLYFLLVKKKINFWQLFKKAQKKDLGLNEFYLATMLAKVEVLSSFPPMIKPIKKEELEKFFLDLAQKLFEKIKPKKS